MAIRPAGPRLTIVDLPAEEKSGLVLPPGVAGRPEVGLVVDVGLGLEGVGIEKGDKVFYHPGHATEVEDVKVIAAECVVAYDDGDRAF